ncbi:MAG: GntR family transcriptional regulator, partial [Gammaproteobacteria bacterium]
VYRSGERLPSVRQLSRQQQVSTATAVAALQLLEDQGHIEVRPRSGYYVRPRLRSAFCKSSNRCPCGRSRFRPIRARALRWRRCN